MLSVVILRFKRPNQIRPYKVIFGKVGPLITVVFMGFLLYMFIHETHSAWDLLRVSAGLIAFGIPAYFAIELFYEKKYVTLRRDLVAKFKHNLDKLPLPNFTFNKILSLAGPFTARSRVIAFNFPLGSFTRVLLKKNVPFKHVSLYNQSSEEIKIFKESVKDRRKIKVNLLRSIKIPSEKTDIFIAYNGLAHAEKIADFIIGVKAALPKGGKFCFYSKSTFLNVSPNAVTVENKKAIEKLFEKQKIKVSYLKKKRFLKTEIFIYGKV